MEQTHANLVSCGGTNGTYTWCHVDGSLQLYVHSHNRQARWVPVFTRLKTGITKGDHNGGGVHVLWIVTYDGHLHLCVTYIAQYNLSTWLKLVRWSFASRALVLACRQFVSPQEIK